MNVSDIVIIARAYGAEEGQPKHESLCDIDSDGDIDIFDLVMAAGHYGDSW